MVQLLRDIQNVRASGMRKKQQTKMTQGSTKRKPASCRRRLRGDAVTLEAVFVLDMATAAIMCTPLTRNREKPAACKEIKSPCRLSCRCSRVRCVSNIHPS